jgi:hypothetical protein
MRLSSQTIAHRSPEHAPPWTFCEYGSFAYPNVANVVPAPASADAG